MLLLFLLHSKTILENTVLKIFTGVSVKVLYFYADYYCIIVLLLLLYLYYRKKLYKMKKKIIIKNTFSDRYWVSTRQHPVFTGRRTAMYFKTRKYETYREKRTGKNLFLSLLQNLYLCRTDILILWGLTKIVWILAGDYNLILR